MLLIALQRSVLEDNKCKHDATAIYTYVTTITNIPETNGEWLPLDICTEQNYLSNHFDV